MAQPNTKRRSSKLAQTAFLAGMLFSGCTALVQIPGANVSVSGEGVFVHVLGSTLVSVPDDQVVIDLPLLDVSIYR